MNVQVKTGEAEASCDAMMDDVVLFTFSVSLSIDRFKLQDPESITRDILASEIGHKILDAIDKKYKKS